jgi:hypothetical protein
MNFKVAVPGSVQVGPRSLTTSVAIGTNFDATGPDFTDDLAAAGIVRFQPPLSPTNWQPQVL